jgi:hypothetical protein
MMACQEFEKVLRHTGNEDDDIGNDLNNTDIPVVTSGTAGGACIACHYRIDVTMLLCQCWYV